MVNLKMLSILIIDDDCLLAESLKEIIEEDLDQPVCVSIVHDGQSALSRIEESRLKDECFDLIITDLNMPGLSGTELVSQIITAATSKTSVMVLSGSGEDLSELPSSSGRVCKVLKPILPQKLVDHVSQELYNTH